MNLFGLSFYCSIFQRHICLNGFLFILIISLLDAIFIFILYIMLFIFLFCLFLTYHPHSGFWRCFLKISFLMWKFNYILLQNIFSSNWWTAFLKGIILMHNSVNRSWLFFNVYFCTSSNWKRIFKKKLKFLLKNLQYIKASRFCWF